MSHADIQTVSYHQTFIVFGVYFILDSPRLIGTGIHLRPLERFADESFVIESLSQPATGMLANRFQVHMTYAVHPYHPSSGSMVQARLEVQGRVSVINVPAIRSAVETFAVPFCKRLHGEWADLMLAHARNCVSEKPVTPVDDRKLNVAPI
jgi:hypothetical protein